MNAAAVVGLGVVSPAGEGVERLWDVCRSGGGEFRPLTHFDASGAGAYVAGFVPRSSDTEPHPGDPDRLAHLAVRAIRSALRDAGATGPGEVTGLVLASTDSGGCTSTEAWRKGDRSDRSLAGGWVGEVAAALGSDGPVLHVNTASASGASALDLGSELIGAGLADRVVVCGADTVTETAYYGLAALRALSSTGCRPFSTRRSGIRLSECAAALVLEDDGHARRRRARRHAVLLGAGSSNAGSQSARPDVGGIVGAVTQALRSADLDASAVGYINAHAAGTRQGDKAEVTALREVFGPHLPRIPVVSSKAALGHCQGAAGAVEALITVLTLSRGEILPTLGLTDIAPEWQDLNFGLGPTAAPRVAVTTSCGLGAVNAALAFGAADD
ncbi:beta-ketoacyl synthase N-terminal-like domain-containing protein [Streptomyces sp. NPDC060022]|uniref:beta-ketoacyl synthase N-terminal-like domain-containing protein n=1 Tax=Streptomyces sp. NPDC060022 TaxID=3347039 RepID=UPI003693B6D4